jgi:hypothetical protein
VSAFAHNSCRYKPCTATTSAGPLDGPSGRLSSRDKPQRHVTGGGPAADLDARKPEADTITIVLWLSVAREIDWERLRVVRPSPDIKDSIKRRYGNGIDSALVPLGPAHSARSKIHRQFHVGFRVIQRSVPPTKLNSGAKQREIPSLGDELGSRIFSRCDCLGSRNVRIA